MKAPSPIAVIRSVLGPEQAEALLRGGVAPRSLARTVLEATAPADLAMALTAAGLEKAEPLSARTVLAVQNLVRLNQMRADRAIREAALEKAEGLEKRSPKLPPDQHGIGPKHEPEEKIAPTKQLEPQVHQNHGAKRPPAAINRRAGILKSEIGRPVDVKTAKPEKVKKECPVYQHIRDAYQAENWSKARDLELRTEGNSTWIIHNGKGLKLIPGIGGGREKARAYIEAARQRALKETINKSDVAEWRSRPVLRAEDAHDLDHAAAARSLSSGSAQEGERQAYEEYSRHQRLDAMAHHFRQAGEAQKRGDRPTSDRHMFAYAGHARALGIDPAGHPPPEVGERIRQLAGKRAAFRGHPADRLA